MTLKQIIYILIFLLSANHGLSKPDDAPKATNCETSDTTEIKEIFQENDLPVSGYLAHKLKPIRENLKRINSITNWTSIDTEELWESTEGGEARYYYQNNRLEKIIAQSYGESFQLRTEYYLLNGQLSFVFEKRYQYNRPFYYDTTVMKKNNDTEAFDFDKSEIIEDRSYFENGTLIHQVNNQDCGAPFSGNYLYEEEKRIKTELNKLINLTTTK